MKKIIKQVLWIFFPKTMHKIDDHPRKITQIDKLNRKYNKLEYDFTSCSAYLGAITKFFEDSSKENGDFIVTQFDETNCRLINIDYTSDHMVSIKVWHFNINDNFSYGYNFGYPHMHLQGWFCKDNELAGGLFSYSSKPQNIDSLCLWICDITGLRINKGLGTDIMKTAIKFARLKNCSSIRGKLGVADLGDPGDNEHKSRLLHFYTKFGFAISLNSDETSGSIILKLK